MDGSDLAGAVACENTHGSTPLLGRPKAGSLVTGRAASPATDGRVANPQDLSA